MLLGLPIAVWSALAGVTIGAGLAMLVFHFETRRLERKARADGR